MIVILAYGKLPQSGHVSHRSFGAGYERPRSRSRVLKERYQGEEVGRVRWGEDEEGKAEAFSIIGGCFWAWNGLRPESHQRENKEQGIFRENNRREECIQARKVNKSDKTIERGGLKQEGVEEE